MFLELCKVKQRIKSKGYEGDTKEMAPPTGLEPVTYGLTVRRSTD